MDFKRNTFYMTLGLEPGLPLTIRQDSRQADYFLSFVQSAEKVFHSLLSDRYSDYHIKRAICQSLMIDLISIIDFLNSKKLKSGLGIDNYNSQYIQEHDLENLFRQVRNGLIHPTEGQGLQHKNTKIAANIAAPFYYFCGEDALFDYSSNSSQISSDADVCFGCGFLRLSSILHILPYLNFASQQVQQLAKIKQRKSLNSTAPIEIIAPRDVSN